MESIYPKTTDCQTKWQVGHNKPDIVWPLLSEADQFAQEPAQMLHSICQSLHQSIVIRSAAVNFYALGHVRSTQAVS